MEKAIITVVGKDQVGIIAQVCQSLAQTNINILDISQTILYAYFINKENLNQILGMIIKRRKKDAKLL